MTDLVEDFEEDLDEDLEGGEIDCYKAFIII